MLISEFSKATELSRDTVRFYVRLGLLRPRATDKGGRRPYQIFTDEDVQAAKIIRVAQSLGMPLKEIANIAKERREGRMTRKRSAEVLRGQLAVLEIKATELQAITAYLRDEIAWLEGDATGSLADFGDYLKNAPRSIPYEKLDSHSQHPV
ncbi:MerR family transcriptional regulator [Rhizobium sp. BK376]|uniref:MerR family transcriptional regulator n=1 Tax=Rhizobium sp. BK376 TaxID=2512149 RepID=UPI0010513CD1|nr:MerR family transcriptional regulator [Rhizobium sp. BK376]TCR80757.1 DNA-binding transcriptional MerR regulator [Rhizobium sp. BK376]